MIKISKHILIILTITIVTFGCQTDQQLQPKKLGGTQFDYITEITESDAWQYYGDLNEHNQQYVAMPFSTIANKYFDLLFDYYDTWDISFAQQLLDYKIENVCQYISTNIEEYELADSCSTDFEMYLDALYSLMNIEINSHTIFQNDELEQYLNSDDYALDEIYPDIYIHDYHLTKLQFLFFIENNIQMQTIDNVGTFSIQQYQQNHTTQQSTKHNLTRKGHNDINDPHIWPNNTITYVFDIYGSVRDSVVNAGNEWIDATDGVLQLRELPNNIFAKIRRNFLQLFRPTLKQLTITSTQRLKKNGRKVAGKTSIGYAVSEPTMYLKPNAKYSTCLHEWGHALGFHHEIQRPDRDDFVYIDTDGIEHISNEQIKQSFQNNTEKLLDSQILPYDLLSFDYGSIMMYTSEQLTYMGQCYFYNISGELLTYRAQHLSETDIEGVKYMYHN